MGPFLPLSPDVFVEELVSRLRPRALRSEVLRSGALTEAGRRRGRELGCWLTEVRRLVQAVNVVQA
jgi:hypothetical protein